MDNAFSINLYQKLLVLLYIYIFASFISLLVIRVSLFSFPNVFFRKKCNPFRKTSAIMKRVPFQTVIAWKLYGYTLICLQRPKTLNRKNSSYKLYIEHFLYPFWLFMILPLILCTRDPYYVLYTTFLGPNGTLFARAISGPKKVSIFRAHPFQCPS